MIGHYRATKYTTRPTWSLPPNTLLAGVNSDADADISRHCSHGYGNTRSGQYSTQEFPRPLWAWWRFNTLARRWCKAVMLDHQTLWQTFQALRIAAGPLRRRESPDGEGGWCLLSETWRWHCIDQRIFDPSSGVWCSDSARQRSVGTEAEVLLQRTPLFVRDGPYEPLSSHMRNKFSGGEQHRPPYVIMRMNSAIAPEYF